MYTRHIRAEVMRLGKNEGESRQTRRTSFARVHSWVGHRKAKGPQNYDLDLRIEVPKVGRRDGPSERTGTRGWVDIVVVGECQKDTPKTESLTTDLNFI